MRIPLTALVCMFSLAVQAEPPAYFKTTFADAQKAAQAAGKPLFIHFTMALSGEDREMEQRVLAKEEVQAALADFVCVSLDCTLPRRGEAAPEIKANMERMKAYGGEGHPFFAVTTAGGDFVYAVRGFMAPETFIHRLARAKTSLKEYQDFQAYAAKADRQSPEFKVRQLKFDLKFRKLEDAKTLADEMLQADPDGTKGLAGEARLAMIALAPLKDGPDATQALFDALKKADPRNEKGLWERAVIAQGERHYKAALKSEDVVEFGEKLAKPTLLIEDLLANAARFDDKRNVYQMALFLYRSREEFAKAHAVVTELLKDAPPADVKTLKAMQAEMKLKMLVEGGGPASRPATTSAPAPQTAPDPAAR